MIDQRPADRFLSDDLDFVALNPARHLDFDYELRHPGHGDQSVHNPRKHGGNGAAVASDLAAGRDVTVAGRDLPGAFDAMANGDGGVNLNRLSTTDGVSFAATGVKVPRSEMPQVPGSKKAEFIAELDGKGVKATRESVDPKSLKPIQSEISGQKSGQMLQSMREGKLLEGDNPLIVSRDGFVVDGHHRWAAAVARSYEVPVALPVLRIDMDAAQLLGEVKAFSEAQSIPARLFDRSVDFHYELRHPGHPDQSVHNPHKGGGAPYAAGAWKPVSPAELYAMDQAVVQDLFKQNKVAMSGNTSWVAEGVRARIYDRYHKGRAQGETYVNGNVVVRLPKSSKLNPEQKQALFDDIDNAAKFTPAGMLGDKSFPIEINVGKVSGSRNGEWDGTSDGGRIGINLTHLKTRKVTSNEIDYPTNKPGGIYRESVPWHPDISTGKDSVTFTIAHEFGHATQSYKLKSPPAGRYQFGYVDVPFISKYAKENNKERYAEHFAAYVLGATDSLTMEIAASDGWRKP